MTLDLVIGLKDARCSYGFANVPRTEVRGPVQFRIQNPKSKIQNLFLGVLCVAAVNLSACQTNKVTTSDGWRMPPQPRAAPVTPASARADRMVFAVGSKPDDTNNNGYPDSIQVSVALFSSQHPTAIQEEGTFIFTLYQQGRSGSGEASGAAAKPIGVWRLSGEALSKALARTFAGPSYLFQLSLLEVGGDKMPLDRADLTCCFEPADGSPPVNSDGVRTIQIGKRMSAQS